jgi:hypothetical protein
MEQLFHQLKQLRLGHAATALTLQQEQPGTYVTVHRDCVDNNNSCGIG